MKLRRGFKLPKGIRVLIVEDIITTGGSVFELVELAKENNAEIVGVVNLVERSQNPIDFGVSSNIFTFYLVKVGNQTNVLCVKTGRIYSTWENRKIICINGFH